MCVVAVKYFDGLGWVGVKNRDRNYQAKIKIVQSNRNETQRLYIDDELTRYTEGLNEHGLCILSASLSVKSDEKEIGKAKPNGRAKNYASPDGKKIRDALLYKTPKEALKHLIDNELTGCTIVFNENECYVLEAGFNIKKEQATTTNPRKFIFKTVKIDKSDFCVRTNHGILLPDLGYAKNSKDDYIQRSRLSSEKRYDYAKKEIGKVEDHMLMLDSLSVTPNSNKFLNPIRTGNVKRGEMVTTGQILLVPKDRTLHYKPIYSSISFEYDKLNNPESKTFFEIISSRKLLGFRNFSKKK